MKKGAARGDDIQLSAEQTDTLTFIIIKYKKKWKKNFSGQADTLCRATTFFSL